MYALADKVNSFIISMSESPVCKESLLRYPQKGLMLLFCDVNVIWYVQLHNTQSKFILTFMANDIYNE